MFLSYAVQTIESCQMNSRLMIDDSTVRHFSEINSVILVCLSL